MGMQSSFCLSVRPNIIVHSVVLHTTSSILLTCYNKIANSRKFDSLLKDRCTLGVVRRCDKQDLIGRHALNFGVRCINLVGIQSGLDDGHWSSPVTQRQHVNNPLLELGSVKAGAQFTGAGLEFLELA